MKFRILASVDEGPEVEAFVTEDEDVIAGLREELMIDFIPSYPGEPLCGSPPYPSYEGENRVDNRIEIAGAKLLTQWLTDYLVYVRDSVETQEFSNPNRPGDSVRGAITPAEFLMEIRDHVAGHPEYGGKPFTGDWTKITDPIDEFCGLCALELIRNGNRNSPKSQPCDLCGDRNCQNEHHVCDECESRNCECVKTNS